MMKYVIICFFSIQAILINSVNILSQEAFSSSLVYLADYDIGYNHMNDWLDMHYDYTIPVLESLEQQEIINGFTIWQHHTGGTYNWRMIIYVTEWKDLDVFWDHFVNNMIKNEALSKSGEMTNRHTDSIWNQGDGNWNNKQKASLAYESLFEVPFSDLDLWLVTVERTTKPVLDKAIDDGILSGYNVITHHTGSTFNSGIIYYFSNWDDIDEVLDASFQAMVTDNEEWSSMSSIIKKHTDIIWEIVPNKRQEN